MKYCPYCGEKFSLWERIFGMDDDHVDACRVREELKVRAEILKSATAPTIRQNVTTGTSIPPVAPRAPIAPTRPNVVVASRPSVYIEEPVVVYDPIIPAILAADIIEDVMCEPVYVDPVIDTYSYDSPVVEDYTPVYEAPSYDSYSSSSYDSGSSYDSSPSYDSGSDDSGSSDW